MATVMITGANRGIGLQVARELASKGYRVYLGTRDSSLNGQQVSDFSGKGCWMTIDVADSTSIRSAADWLSASAGKLDVLINNAGIYPDEGVSISDISRERLVETFQTNTFGPVEVTQAFMPLLRESALARVINVSSGYGQLGGLSAHVPSYCLSKLTLNGVTIMLADKLRGDGISVNSVCPGWVRTDMGGTGASRSVEEGAAGIVWLASKAPQRITGKFFRDGKKISW